MEIDFKTPSGVLLKLAATAVSGAPAVYSFLQMLNGRSPADVVCGGVFLLLSLYIFGIFCAIIYAGSAAASLTDFLLFPGHFLKKAPPILSRQQGLIAGGRFEEAKEELLEMRHSFRTSPEITLMLAELLAEKFNDLEAAVTECHFYFKHRSWRYSELNLPILLRYADWQLRLGNREEVIARLQKDAKAPFYPKEEKKALLARLASLGEQSPEK